MVGVVINTSFDDAGLTARCSRAFYDAVSGLGDAIRHDCEIYVPYDTGALCRSVSRKAASETGDGVGCDIVWSSPYASAVYYGDTRGVRYHTEHHTHAQARWFDGAYASCADAWVSDVRASVQAELHV